MDDKKEAEIKLIQAETKRIETQTKHQEMYAMFLKKQAVHNMIMRGTMISEIVLLMIITYGLLK